MNVIRVNNKLYVANWVVTIGVDSNGLLASAVPFGGAYSLSRNQNGTSLLRLQTAVQQFSN